LLHSAKLRDIRGHRYSAPRQVALGAAKAQRRDEPGGAYRWGRRMDWGHVEKQRRSDDERVHSRPALASSKFQSWFIPPFGNVPTI